MSLRKLLVAGTCSVMFIGIAISSEPAYAGFLGDTLTGTWNYNTISIIASNPGTGFSGPGIVSPSITFFFEGSSATVTNTQIVETNFTPGGYAPASFNGFVITDLTSSKITGASIDSATDVPGFDSSDLSFTSNSVATNVEGLNIPSTSDQIVIDVTFAPVTTLEPASFTLLGVSLLGIAAVRLRKGA